MIKTEKKCGIYETYPKRDMDKEGGLRVQGIYKESTEEYPLITYITVVYNRKNTLMDCMNSVWLQDYPNIEYIIVDGASTDGTLELIEQNADKIDYYISQPDKGIYDAMNKGITLARGKFICFMNSDDQCMPEAAKNVAEIYRKTKADIICGSRELAQNGKRVYEAKYPRYCIKRSVFRYVQMFHQSTYASSQVFDNVGYFDKKYSLLADWIWESKAIDAGFDIRFVEEELARFSYDGASCQGIYQRDREWEEWAQSTFPGLDEKDAVFFVKRTLNAYKINVTDEVATYLVSVCTEDKQTLINEFRKIVAYLEQGETLTKDVIDKICSKTLDAKVFDLLDLIIAKKKSEALLMLEDILAQNTYIGIVSSMLFKQIKQIYLIKLTEKEKGLNSVTAKELGIHPFVFGKLKAVSSMYKIQELENLMLEFDEYDENSKTGKVDIVLGLKQIILKM